MAALHFQPLIDEEPVVDSTATCVDCWMWVRPRQCPRKRSYPKTAHRPSSVLCPLGSAVGGHEPVQPEAPLACGLTPSQVSDLLFRDITPNDYDVLLLLDETSEVSPVARNHSFDSLPSACAEEYLGEMCTVCLHAFEPGDSVSILPCKHLFHSVCIDRWLSQRRSVCPVCSDEVQADRP
eukprot:gnl/TRDRNA2_/TRDRNA2_80224_c1_seq1.p1 gnl/TRDRNA2_/TRDRNA2_80224_c1~~gnl/TRDRNA2_/TRDRNA2_80224_c1_seq1.p1  ORF type:complete len:180 (+),score=12.90 gnl/TRDRNA2_/TRDRNA2_80224_c1_seq1:108-647(+)